jgi:hypothetical protein
MTGFLNISKTGSAKDVSSEIGKNKLAKVLYYDQNLPVLQGKKGMGVPLLFTMLTCFGQAIMILPCISTYRSYKIREL